MYRNKYNRYRKYHHYNHSKSQKKEDKEVKPVGNSTDNMNDRKSNQEMNSSCQWSSSNTDMSPWLSWEKNKKHSFDKPSEDQQVKSGTVFFPEVEIPQEKPSVSWVQLLEDASEEDERSDCSKPMEEPSSSLPICCQESQGIAEVNQDCQGVVEAIQASQDLLDAPKSECESQKSKEPSNSHSKYSPIHCKIYIYEGLIFKRKSVHRCCVKASDIETFILSRLNRRNSMDVNYRFEYRDCAGEWIEMDGSKECYEEMERQYKFIRRKKSRSRSHEKSPDDSCSVISAETSSEKESMECEKKRGEKKKSICDVVLRIRVMREGSWLR